MDNERLARIEAILERMERELFGNGQPGLLKEMRDDLDDLMDSRAKVRGALAIIGTSITALGSTLIAHMRWGKF